MVEEFSAEERREGVEEAGIAHGPSIEAQSELEEGEIIDSPMAAIEEQETIESMRAEVEDGEIVESPSNEVEELSFAYSLSSGAAIETSTNMAKGLQSSHFSCSSDLENFGDMSFNFTSTEQIPVSKSNRRKPRRRITISSIPSANHHILSAGTGIFHSLPETRQESQTSVFGDASHESGKMWLLRGNEACAKEHFLEAESCYTHAVNFASEIRISRRCNQALMLCHSNRAATRMCFGRMRYAIGDCEIALANDPNFLRARARMANYLALGDIEAAMNNYNKCFEAQEDASPEWNKKILFEASDGLKKAKQVDDCMNLSMEFLRKRMKDDAVKALGIISMAMSISTHSESLLEMKVECLLLDCNYEEIIQICEHTLDKIQRNSIVIDDNGSGKPDISEDKLWRWRVLSMAYFYLGRLEQALELLQKHENLKPVADKFGSMFPKNSTSLSIVICELLGLKAAGNEAFNARKFSDAVDHYTAALSRPFVAICLCSRVAVYQELGRVIDAISDCCFAITLDSRI